jgi:hypothetical protein
MQDRENNVSEKGSMNSMQRFFENKLAFAAILLLFALAMVCNATIGGSQSKANDWTITAATHSNQVVSKGPNLPPDPWEWRASNSVRKGPNLPPDPWEWNKSQNFADHHTYYS